MKKNVLSIIIVLIVFLVAGNLQSQVVVKVKPNKPTVIVKKPPHPGGNVVWIDGHWLWNKKQKKYVWEKGHWANVKAGHDWVPGHWVDTPKGFKWVPGQWKRHLKAKNPRTKRPPRKSPPPAHRR